MKVSEAFLVNTKNFEVIITTLVKQNTEEIAITSSLLEDLGFSDPNDLLVIRILKDFNVIDNNGGPGKHYQEFANPKTTKLALAKGLVSAYKPLFEEYPKIHQAPSDKIKQAFEEIFEGKKTELIIKYISGTFQKISSFVGPSTINSILEEESIKESQEQVVAEVESSGSNGTMKSSENLNEAENGEVSKESIDELVNSFDEKKLSDTSPEDVSDDEDDKHDENEAERTIQKFIQDDDQEDPETKNGDPFNFEDDPFNFDKKQPPESPDSTSESTPEPESAETTQEPETPKTTTEQEVDTNPVDLDIPLSMIDNPDEEASVEKQPEETEFVEKALIRKSEILQKMQRWDELVPTLEEIIQRYENSSDQDLSDIASRAVIRRAIVLLKLNRSDALPALNSVIDRFKDSDNKEFFDQATRAMLYKANFLESNGSEDLLPLYNAIIDRLGQQSDIIMKEKLDEIHLKRFDLIIDKGESSEIFEASSKLIERLKGRNTHQTYLKKAMIIRAEMLDNMGQEEEALAAYDQFLATFGS